MPAKIPTQGLQTLPDKRGRIKNCTKGKSYPCGKACLAVGSAILEQCIQGMKASSSQKASKLAKALLKKAAKSGGSASGDKSKGLGVGVGTSGNSTSATAVSVGVNKPLTISPPVPPVDPNIPTPPSPPIQYAFTLDKLPPYNKGQEHHAITTQKRADISKQNLAKMLEYGQKDVDELKAQIDAIPKTYEILRQEHEKSLADLENAIRKSPVGLPPMDMWDEHQKIQTDYMNAQDTYDKQVAAVLEKYRQKLMSDRGIAPIEAEIFAKKQVKYASNLTKGFNGSYYGKPELQRDIAEVYRMSSGTIAATIKKIAYQGERAWATRNGSVSINMGIVKKLEPEIGIGTAERQKKRTMYHELGHHIEYSVTEEVNAAIKRWIVERSTGDPVPLSQLIKNAKYDNTEIAYPDHFVSPYVGKIYSDFDSDIEPDTGSTEVVSMGFQHLSDPKYMRKLLEKDPEHFALIVAVLKSTENNKMDE